MASAATTQDVIRDELFRRGLMARTGTVFYVRSGASGAGGGADLPGHGLSVSKPFLTLTYAATRATASRGDAIVLMEGHAETIIAAAGAAVAKAGVKVVGLGNGRNRPTFTFTTAAGASFDISAANVHLENVVLINGIDSQTAMVNVTAANVTIKGCEFMTGDATTQAIVAILASDAADRIVVEDNYFHGSADAGTTSVISCGATDDAIIRNNIIIGAHATTGSVLNSAAAINFNVIGNFILNQTADGNNKAIILHGSSTGIIANNRGAVIDSSAPAPVTAAAAFVAHNYWSSAAGVTASVLM